MDRADLEKLKAKGILKEDTVFLVSAKDKNISILKQYLPENINPEQPNLTGWFKIGSETIAIPKEQLKELPKAKRLEVRSDASKQLLILALIFLAIITLRFVASYFQTVFTAYFSQTAMADLRHDVAIKKCLQNSLIPILWDVWLLELQTILLPLMKC